MARKLARIVCVVLVLAGYGVACIGLPLPKLIVKDRSRPFACADRSCGCMSADDCWNDCCCFTREQKLAWAVEHGVAVPAWVLNERQEQDLRLESRGSGDRPTSSCCQRAVAKSCCAGKKAAGSCCNPTVRPRTTEKTEWVIGMLARKCRGQGSDWLSAGAVLPGPLPIVWQPYSPRIGEVASSSILLETTERAPPVPPPRIWQVG